ncbi:MAG: translational GTPase TypA [Bacteroidales bacterium]|nr:translational GTPase TypA [Bacteroidales bacterium]
MTKIKNIAIIAHVDHGKTTLVDRLLYQGQLFRENQNMGDLILDSNDLERERGITILSKNVAIHYKGYKINVIDTPGHSDFGGEVERVLNMADGCLLVVDAFEGPMPQTRFVLQKAIELNLKPIVVINKVDKPNCNPEDALEQVFELMFSLDASEDQLNFPVVYGSAKNGWMGADWKTKTTDVKYLLDMIVEHIPDTKSEVGTPQLMISSLDYSSYVGRIAVGKLTRGTLQAGMNISVVKRNGVILKSKIKELFLFEGLGKERVKTPVHAGDICAILGPENFDIGDTIADFENPEGLVPINIDEPTMSMLFTINNSPFYGKEGKLLTSRHVRDRLFKETEKNLALRVKETESADRFLVFGRGILHLSVLIETMRREGYELQVGQPQVITKDIDGVKCEPIEFLTVHVPDSFSGKVIEAVSFKKGEILNIVTKNDRVHLEFSIPSRGLIGLRNVLLTSTEGEAVMAHRLKGFEPWKGDLPGRRFGALIAMESGMVTSYALDGLQDRGKFFVSPMDKVYAGQVVGEYIRSDDLVVNVVKAKKMSNMRASGADDKASLAPPIKFSLEEFMEYIGDDEYLEVTPLSLRLRKIMLDEHDRKRQKKQLNS